VDAELMFIPGKGMPESFGTGDERWRFGRYIMSMSRCFHQESKIRSGTLVGLSEGS
jgi:hypothetical protein